MSKLKAPAANSKPGKKRPKKITPDYLHNAGLYYLQRFAASSAGFRAVMLRKARRSCAAHPDQDLEHCTALIDELVAKFQRAGLLNDNLYATGMVNTLRRQGKSQKAIIGKLKVKGIKPEMAIARLRSYDEETKEQDGDLRAALIFARKKKIGPYAGTKITSPEKALAALGRAGFSYEIAGQILRMNLKDVEKL